MNQVDERFRHAHELHLRGRAADALRIYQEVVQADPRHAEAWHRMGCIYNEAGAFQPAVDCFTRAIRLHGAEAPYHNNLGECYRKQGRLDQALVCYQQAVHLESRYIVAHANLAHTLYALGRTEEADRAADEAIRLEPSTVEAHCILGTLLLSRGDYAKGWQEHEWRLSLRNREPPWLDPARWKGERLNGQTLLIRAEQGLGDTLQFIRYLPLVKQRAGSVVVDVQPPLRTVLEQSGFGDSLARPGATPSFDVHCPLMSLLAAMPELQSEPFWREPYLKADAKRVDEWRPVVQTPPGFAVGIVWAGNPSHGNDRFRTCQLAEFLPLAQIPGVRLFSLQKDHGGGQLADLAGKFEVVDLGPRLRDFSDTAAVMMNLDLVISVDTAPVHLAGGLGVPVWVAIPAMPDWRWTQRGESSPWYPTLRLFRQTHLGVWNDVFARMATELAGLAAGRAC